MVANNNPPSHCSSSSIQALEASSSFRDSQCGRKKLGSPGSAMQRHVWREGDELGAAKPAQRSRVGKRGRPRKELAEASCLEKGSKSRPWPHPGPQEEAHPK